MIEKILKEVTISIRYTMNKEEYEYFKTSHNILEVVSEADTKITVDVLDHRYISERYK